ncbi:MAG: hypothetical protein QM674_16785 [Burkholderiaceae bacterium]
MNIHLHIGRLVVDGLPLTPAQARTLSRDVQAHLAALIADSPPAQAGGYAVAALDAPALAWPGMPGHGGVVAERIARSLHGALAARASSPRADASVHGFGADRPAVEGSAGAHPGRSHG